MESRRREEARRREEEWRSEFMDGGQAAHRMRGDCGGEGMLLRNAAAAA